MEKGLLAYVRSVSEKREEKGIPCIRSVAHSLQRKADGMLEASHTRSVDHEENIIRRNDPNHSCLDTFRSFMRLHSCLQSCKLEVA